MPKYSRNILKISLEYLKLKALNFINTLSLFSHGSKFSDPLVFLPCTRIASCWNATVCGVRRADFCISLRADLIFRACRMSRGFLTRNLRAACFVLIQNGVNDSRDYCPNCMRKQQQQQQGERKLSGIVGIISVSSLDSDLWDKFEALRVFHSLM